MAFNQGAICKYGSPAHSASSTNLTLITGEIITKFRTLQNYTPAPIRHSRMSGNYENNNSQCSPDEARNHVLWKQQKERALALGHIFGDVARSPEHEAWERLQEVLQTRGGEPASSTPNSGSIQYKSAQIHDPTKNQMTPVMVIEDSGCGINFISPRVAKLCNLTLFSASPIHNQTLMGTFTSNQWTEVSWCGSSSSNSGRDWFYIAPEGAPIEVLVGTKFMRDHPNAFNDRAQLEPAFLNVQTKVTPAEQSQIQADEALANRQAAELDNRKRHAKQHKPRDKGKQAASTSSSGSSRRKKEGFSRCD